MLLADFLEWRRRTRRQANAPSGGSGGGRREEPPPADGGRLGMVLDAARHLEQRDTEPETVAARARESTGYRLLSPQLAPWGSLSAALRSDADPMLSAGFYPLDEPEPAPETAPVPPGRAAPRIEVTPAGTPTVQVAAQPDSQPARRGPGRAASTWASMVGADWSARSAAGPGAHLASAAAPSPAAERGDPTGGLSRRARRPARLAPPPAPYRFRPYTGLSTWNPTSANLGVAGGAEVFG